MCKFRPWRAMRAAFVSCWICNIGFVSRGKIWNYAPGPNLSEPSLSTWLKREVSDLGWLLVPSYRLKTVAFLHHSYNLSVKHVSCVVGVDSFGRWSKSPLANTITVTPPGNRKPVLSWGPYWASSAISTSITIWLCSDSTTEYRWPPLRGPYVCRPTKVRV